MTEPSVAIIIINYFTETDTRECLLSIINNTDYKNWSAYVINNGSVGENFRNLKSEIRSAKIHWVDKNSNTGFAKANNEIIKKTNADYVMLINNDLTVDKMWLKKLVAHAENGNKPAVVQPKVISYYDRQYFEYAGGAGGFLDQLGYPYVRGRIGFFIEEDVGQYDNAMPIFWASGSAMLVRRSIFEKVGFLDETFFMYQEEIDFCFRAKKLGFGIEYCPEAIVHHKGASSAKRNFFKRTYLVHRNNLKMVLKNMPVNRLIWIIPVRIFMDLISGLYYTYRRKYSYIFSIILAHLSLILETPYLIKYRLTAPKNLADITSELKPFSIYWYYFLLRRKRYSEIFGGGNGVKSKILRYTVH